MGCFHCETKVVLIQNIDKYFGRKYATNVIFLTLWPVNALFLRYNYYLYTSKRKTKEIMTINERHDLIIKELDTKGQVSVTELSTMLNVSEVTIRKDLTLLEQSNRLYRAHGKAIKMSPYINDRDVKVKFSQYPTERPPSARRQSSSSSQTIRLSSHREQRWSISPRRSMQMSRWVA